MPPSPDPAGLLDVSRRLAAQETPEASRRAVSTAYYALFHRLVAQAADRFVGAGDQSPAYAMFYRSLDHTRIRFVLVELGKSNLRNSFRKALGRSRSSDALSDFANTFIVLQEARELADYHPFLAPTARQEVEDLIDEAARAMQTFASLDSTERTEMLALMIAGARS